MFAKTVAIFGMLSMSPFAFAETAQATGTPAKAVRVVEAAVRKEAAQREANYVWAVGAKTAAAQRKQQRKQEAANQKREARDAAYAGIENLNNLSNVQALAHVLDMRNGRIMLASVDRPAFIGPGSRWGDAIVLDGHGIRYWKTRPTNIFSKKADGFYHMVPRPLKALGVFKRGYFSSIDMAGLKERLNTALVALDGVANNGGKIPDEWKRSVDDQERNF